MPVCRLHVVVGKGGVGKSTVSAALALAAARRNPHVLGVELEEPSGLSRLLDARAERAGEIVSSASGVSLSWFEGGAALAEYLERIIHLGPLLQPVIEHPLYRAFVGAAPGLSGLMLIGKVRDEVALKRSWDTVVLDAGATGHALELLRMPAVAASTFLSGRVHREATKIRAFLADPARTRVHVVATPEAMATSEAGELVARLSNDLGLRVASLVMNFCRPSPPSGIENALGLLRESPANDSRHELRRELVELVDHEISCERRQQHAIERIARRTGLGVTRLPRLVASDFGRAELEVLADRLEELV